MSDNNHAYNRKILAGCGALLLVIIMGLTAVLAVAWQQDRHAARYPGSRPIASHNNYSRLPSRFHWDNAYGTADPFVKVYNWYSTTFDLGAEARANGECIALEGSRRQWLIERQTSVLLCDARGERLIFVSRSTAFNR
jgi:hypothetical protein